MSEEQQEKKKRAKPVTMTARSMKYLKEQGYLVALVERSIDVPRFGKGFKPGDRFRNKFDAFGFADLIAVKPGTIGTLYVQTTTADHQSERRTKILEALATKTILECRNRIVVHGWSKKGARGMPKLWSVTVAECLIVGGQLKFDVIDDKDSLFPD
jgi:hypothetical protein